MSSLEPGGSRRSGQALIESCLVVALICLIFFGVFQLSQLFASQEVLDYAAGRGARARTVGFNHFMVLKTVLVGAIPNAGKLLNPAHTGGPARQYALESARIPLYLGAQSGGELGAILDYDGWGLSSLSGITVMPSYSLGDGTLRQEVKQTVDLTRYPFHRAYYAADSFPMTGQATLDEHYSLYLEDAGW